jgi:hypothetical protein
LMNPVLMSLHSTVLIRLHLHMLKYSEKRAPAMIFTKPSTWHVYRACIEQMFVSTPLFTLFYDRVFGWRITWSVGALWRITLCTYYGCCRLACEREYESTTALTSNRNSDWKWRGPPPHTNYNSTINQKNLEREKTFSFLYWDQDKWKETLLI